MKTLGCAVIGCGVIAPLHVECLLRVEGAEVTWLCDLDAAKAEALRAKCPNARICTDLKEVLADERTHAIHICTDHGSHAAIAVQAFAAGKHVLCEKPLAAQPAQLDVMLQAHRERPELVFAGIFQHRFEPVNRFLKQLVDDGLLGTLLSASAHVHCLRTDEYYKAAKWRGTWGEEGGGVLINQAIHFIDCLAWIMGGVTRVSGSFSNRTHSDSIEVEDTAVAALEFRKGALGVIEATSSTPHLSWDRHIEIHGSHASIEQVGNHISRIVASDAKLEREMKQRLADIHEVPKAAGAKAHYGPGHPAQIADFVEAARSNQSPFVDGQAARHAVDIVHAIYRSARERSWVEIG